MRVELEGTRVESKLAPGAMFIAPANTAADYEVDGQQGFVALAIHKNAIDRFRDQAGFELPKDFGKLREQMFHHPIVEALILGMLEQAMMDHPTSDLFLDQATNTILTSPLCRSGTMQPNGEPSGPLSDHDIATVAHIVQKRLEENLTIADLARVASLSDWHFARTFKESTGLSPHRFVLRRRIVRAKELLQKSAIPLTEISAAAGFSAQSHMTDMFRQQVGATPRRYRASFQA